MLTSLSFILMTESAFNICPNLQKATAKKLARADNTYRESIFERRFFERVIAA